MKPIMTKKNLKIIKKHLKEVKKHLLMADSEILKTDEEFSGYNLHVRIENDINSIIKFLSIIK